MSYIDFRSYSDHDTPLTLHFKNGETEDSTLTFGVEVEVEPKGNASYATVHNLEARQLIYDIVGENIYYKHDGSLNSGDAFEAISEPCTLSYHQYTMRWKHVFKTLLRCGYRAHDTENCGLHIHVGRKAIAPTDEERKEVIQKIQAFLALHMRDVIRFSRRRERELDNWCSFSFPRELLDSSLSLEEFIEVAHHLDWYNHHQDRYTVLNCATHDPTIEFRIFKGTLKRDTFIASIQFCSELVKYCQTATWEEVRNSSFLSPFRNTEHLELRAYLVARGLMNEADLGQLRRQPDFVGIDGIASAVA